MNWSRDLWNPRRRVNKIALVITSVVAVLVIASVAIGCGSAKKSATTVTITRASGRHGNGIAYVKVIPSKQTLRRGATETIVIKPRLTFVVGVQNDGDFLEHNVKVTLVIHQLAPVSSITRTLTIPQIWNGATKEVDFIGPFDIGTMISVVPINVDVHPVTGEANLSNNSATYEVRFSF